MHRAFFALITLVLFGLAAGAQFRPMVETPETDPKAFDITTRADLEDSIRRVESLRRQLKEARSDREKLVVTESILALCQDELGKQSNASGAIVSEKSTNPKTLDMALRWTGAFTVLESIIRGMGPDGLANYERLYGPRAESLLQTALASRDLAAMASINNRFGLTQAGIRAATVLAATSWEAGDYSRCARALERALSAPELIDNRRRAALCAWLSHCYRALGERANLTRLLAETTALADQMVDEGGNLVALGTLVKRNLEAARDTSSEVLSGQGLDWPGGNFTNTGLHAQPTDYAQIAWARLLPRLEASMQSRFMNYPLPIVPPYQPVFDGNAVYVNTGDRVVAYDLVGGGTGDEPLWSCKPFPTLPHNWRTSEPDPAMILPVTAWRGTVYAALENPLTTTFHDRNPDPMFGLYSHYPQVRRALCAMDSGTGRLLWKLGGLYEGREEQVTSFLYATVYDGVLYAIGTRQPQFSEVYLYALDPISGETLWNLRVCYGQQETTMFGRPARTPFPSLCAISGGNLYLNTNLGGVVSVNLTRRCLNWISRYDYIPRPITKYTDTYYRVVTWANNPTFYTEVGGKPYLVIAPTDAEMMFGLDARTGEILWRLDREVYLQGGRVLAGVRDGIAWVAADGGYRGLAASRLHGVDVRLGRITSTIRVTPADRGTTVPIAGRPTMAGNRLYWPGAVERECMVCEVDLDAARVAASSYAPATYAGVGYSVFAQNGILFTVSGNDYSRGSSQLAVRFNQSALLDSARKAVAADPANAEAALHFGLLALRLADSNEALKQLKNAFDLASQAPVNTRVREHASRAMVAWHLKRADAALAARKNLEALGSVQAAREFALMRSQRSDCFAREERALIAAGNMRNLREMYETMVSDDPDFGVGEDPEIPARTYGAIRLAALLEATEPDRAARMYQEIQEAPERLAWQGVKLRTLGLDRLKGLIKAHGRGLYATQESAAAKLLESNTPESLSEILRRYPLAEASDEAAMRVAAQAMGRGDGAEAVNVLTAALEDNSARTRRGELNAMLALAHAKTGERLRARLVAARTLREFPNGKLKQGEGEVSFKDVLGPLAGGGANSLSRQTMPRLPGEPTELWHRDWEAGSFTRVPTHPATTAMSRVYLGERSSQGFQIVAIDGPSGEMVWSRASDVNLMAAHDTEHGILFETAQGFSLYDDNGTERWSVATGGTPNPVSMEGGMLVYGTRFTNTATRKLMVRVCALDIAGGGQLWQAEFEASVLRWIGQGPSGVMLLLSGTDQRLCLVDAESGVLTKSVTLEVTGQINVLPAMTDDAVWLVDVFGQVRGYGLDDLEARGSFSTGQRGAALLRVQDGRIVSGGGEGACCIEIETGKTLWTKPMERGELLRAVQYSGGVIFLCTRDATGGARVNGFKVADGTVAFRYSAPRGNDSDRLELQASAAFDGGVVIAYSVHTMIQGGMQLAEFRLLLLNADGTERMSWSHETKGATASIAQIALTEGHVILGCANATFCFGKK